MKDENTSRINVPLLKISFLLLLLKFGFTSYFIEGQRLPAERKIEWAPGIPDGIPDPEWPVYNILEYGADNSGNLSVNSAFSATLKAIPENGGILLLPEGTYRFTQGIDIDRSNVIIRGEGIHKTRLLFDTGDACISIETYQRGNWQDIVSGYRKGSYKVIVKEGHQFSIGLFAEIQQENDQILMYTNPEWNVNWGDHSVGQFFQIENVKADTVWFNIPLNIDFEQSLNPQIRPQNLLVNVGIEDLYLEKLKAEDSHSIIFKNTAYCWVDNIESYHTYRTHLTFFESLANEVRNSYFHHSFDYAGGGHGYGVECNRHSTNILVENNIFDSLRHAMIIQVGANGCVYAYNYSTNPVQGKGETNLNQDWVPPDISIHGHYPLMNLFEGNHVYEVGIGDWWGPAGPGNTFFRNKVVGDGILYYDHSHQQNVISNITTVLKDVHENSNDKIENANIINGKLYWYDSIDLNGIPNSYFHETKPKYFGDLDWPVFGHEGGKYNKLPAEYRYENIVEEKRRDQGFFLGKWKPKYAQKPESELKQEPVQNSTVKIIINPKDTIGMISPYIGGHDLNPYWGKYYDNPELLKDIQNLNPGILRYPAGSGSDRFFWDRHPHQGTPSDAPVSNALFGQSEDPSYPTVDHNYILRDSVNAMGINVVNYGYARYGTSADPVAKAAHYAAEWVRYDNGRTLFWEIGNENYGKWEDGYSINTALNKDGQPHIINGELYGRHFKVFADSMRHAANQIGAEIYVGAVGYHSETANNSVVANWNHDVLSYAGEVADFVIVHRYLGNWSDADALEILQTAEEIIHPKIVIDNELERLGMDPLPVALTEWNIRYKGREQNVSCINGLHAALSSGYILEGKYGQASRWNLVWNYNEGESHGLFATNKDYELEGVDAWDPRAPFFYMYFFNQMLGDVSVYSYVEQSHQIKSFASVFSSGDIGITVINTSDIHEIAKLKVNHFNIGEKYYFYSLTGDGGIMSRKVLINGHGTDKKGGGPDNYTKIKAYSSIAQDSIKLELPPYSATYILIEGKDAIPVFEAKFKIYAMQNDSVYPLSNAKVELDLLQAYTNKKGEIALNHLPGNYSYHISKYGFKGNNCTLSLKKDTLIKDTLEFSSYQVSIQVKDALTQKNLDSCTVTFGNITTQTTNHGPAVFNNVVYDAYNLQIQKEHYETISMTNIIPYSDTIFHITISPVFYNLQIDVKEENTGKHLSGIDLGIDDLFFQTDMNGNVNIGKTFGQYILSLNNTGYTSIKDSFLLNADTSITYIIRKTRGNVSFKISSQETPVNKAEIIFQSDTLFSNAIGMVKYEDIAFDNTYRYSVTRDGYKAVNDSVFIHYDTTLRVPLLKTKVDIAFHILNNDIPLENIPVMLNGNEKFSNPEGILAFNDLPVDSTYDYVIETENYHHINGQILAIYDTTVTINMVPVQTSHLINNTFLCYPNPVTERLIFDNPEDILVVSIIDVTGKKYISGKLGGNQSAIDISHLPEGIYFLKVITKTKNVQTIKILKI